MKEDKLSWKEVKRGGTLSIGRRKGSRRRIKMGRRTRRRKRGERKRVNISLSVIPG